MTGHLFVLFGSTSESSNCCFLNKAPIRVTANHRSSPTRSSWRRSRWDPCRCTPACRNTGKTIFNHLNKTWSYHIKGMQSPVSIICSFDLFCLCENWSSRPSKMLWPPLISSAWTDTSRDLHHSKRLLSAPASQPFAPQVDTLRRQQFCHLSNPTSVSVHSLKAN